MPFKTELPNEVFEDVIDAMGTSIVECTDDLKYTIIRFIKELQERGYEIKPGATAKERSPVEREHEKLEKFIRSRPFKFGAWLYTIDPELTDREFIQLAASTPKGLEYLLDFHKYRFVSIVLDGGTPLLVGHDRPNTIAMAMQGHEKWQTMEWK